jgi:hypothetical protein
MWRTALCALGASAMIAGCATDSTDEDGLAEGTYAVTSYDVGNCTNETWVKSSTPTSAIHVEASGDGFVVKGCTEQDGAMSCTPSSPSSYQWSIDAWRGNEGGAYLVESGCSMIHVDAMARMADGQLVIETSRWSATLAGGTCTYDEVVAMRETNCDYRVRLHATAQ